MFAKSALLLSLMRLLALSFILLINMTVLGQSENEDSVLYTKAVSNAKKVYWQYLSPSATLYNGPEYVDYVYSLKDTHPFFETNSLKNGSVLYDGVLFKDVPVMYDIVKDQVVINDPFGVYKITLINERISEFSIETHRFVRLTEDEKNVVSTGFYEVLYDGSVTAYKKNLKKLKEETSMIEGLKRYTVEADLFYLKKDGKFYSISSKSNFLSLMKDHKTEVAQYIRKNKLSFKKDKTSTIAKVCTYYDQLKK